MSDDTFGTPTPPPGDGAPQVPPVDVGNPILGPGPALLSLHRITPPGGEQLVSLTIRTHSTTMTVFLGRDDALNWARMLRAEAHRRGWALAPAAQAVGGAELSGLIVASGLNGAHR